MCGIAGFIAIHSRQALNAQAFLSDAASILHHRGPDGWGYYLNETQGIGLLHTRLAILDPEHGAQPMSFGDWVISFNGEIYNYRELKTELEALGLDFHSHCDTEVLLKAVATWGQSAFEKFNGEWACLLWNRRQNILWASRDRYGIRPLYVLDHAGYRFFASETKAFDAIPGYHRNLTPAGLAQHALLWNTLEDQTVFAGIRSVVPATVEQHDAQGRVSVHHYYHFPTDIRENLSLDDAIAGTAELLESSVRLRMRSDVPVGMYLSGGLDSTVVAGIVNKRLGLKLDSFSVAFTDSNLDESPYQREIARATARHHKEVMVDPDTLAQHIADAAYHFERPVFRTAPVPLYLLSQQVNAGGYKVVLTGEGADEVFCGYDAFKETKLARFWSRHQGAVKAPLLLKLLYRHLSHYQDDKNLGLMKMFYEPFLAHGLKDTAGLQIRLHNNSALLSFLSEDAITTSNEGLMERLLAPMAGSSDWAQRQQYAEFRTLLAGYLLSSQGDRMTMANSVEARFPFLDHRLVDFSMRLPARYKLKGFNQKYVLKKAFSDIVPDSIIQRPKMPYQAPDIGAFVQNGNLHPLAGDLLSPEAIRRTGLISAEKIQKLMRKAIGASKAGKPLGYRDNMIFTFALTTQLSCHWANNKRTPTHRHGPAQVALIEH